MKVVYIFLLLFVLCFLITEMFFVYEGPGEYLLNICDSYYIHSLGSRSKTRRLLKKCEAVSATAFTGTVEGSVRGYAVSDRLILGEMESKYFVLDITKVEPHDLSLGHAIEYFKSREEWQESLRDRGILDAPVLSNPDDVAEELPRHVIKPWDYELMSNFLGLSDEHWFFMFFCVICALCCLVGVYVVRKKLRIYISGASGLVLGIFVFCTKGYKQDIIYGSILAYLIFLPLAAVAVGEFGCFVRQRLNRGLAS